MKKIYLALTFILCLSVLSRAQITITSADLPAAGLAFTTAHDDNYVAHIPAGGASQTWNYSGLLNTYVDTVAFISAAGTPWASQVPSANLAIFSPSTGNYSYFTSSSTGFYQNGGSDTGVTGGFAAYNPPYLFIPTPFTYNNTRTSTARVQIITTVYDSTFGLINVKIVHHIQSSFLCDGWGTLILPNATYSNTLRVKVTEHNTDSLFADLTGLGFYTFILDDSSQAINYRWVGHGPAAYLLGIDADSLGTTSVSSEYLLNSVVLGTENLASGHSQIRVYPNPASGNVNFRWSSNLNPAALTVYNQMGQEVLKAEMSGMDKLEIPVSSLPNGIYSYQLKMDDGNFEKGKFIVSH